MDASPVVIAALGVLITLGGSLVGIAVTYGKLAARLEATDRQLSDKDGGLRALRSSIAAVHNQVQVADAAATGRLDRTDHSLGELDRRLERLQTSAGQTSAYLQRLGSRFDGVEILLQGLDGRLDKTDVRLVSIEGQVSAQYETFHLIATASEALTERLRQLELSQAASSAQTDSTLSQVSRISEQVDRLNDKFDRHLELHLSP